MATKKQHKRANLYRRHKAFSELMGARVTVLSALMAAVGLALFVIGAAVAIVQQSETAAAMAVILCVIGWLPTYLDIKDYPEE